MESGGVGGNVGARIEPPVPVASQRLDARASDIESQSSKGGTGNTSFFDNVTSGIQSITNAALSAGASVLSGMNPQYGVLLSLQLEAQREMQMVTMISNVYRSRHEAEMAAVRNLRVS